MGRIVIEQLSARKVGRFLAAADDFVMDGCVVVAWAWMELSFGCRVRCHFVAAGRLAVRWCDWV